MISVSRVARLGVPVFVLALALGSAQCGLLESPGDYSGGGSDDGMMDAAAEGSTGGDGSMSKDGAVVLPDGFVVPASIGTIALVAGERDPTTVDDDPAWSADAWSGILAANGDVVTWRIEESAPIVGSFVTGGLVGPKWVMINDGFGIFGGRATAIQTTGWAPGIVGDWKAGRANGAPGGLDEAARAFYGTHLFYVGGTRTNPGVDGGPPSTFFTKEVHLSTVDNAVPDLSAVVDGANQLINARSRPGLWFDSGTMYVVGGRFPGGITSSVEMSKVDVSTGAVQAFAETSPLMSNGMPHRVFAPAVASGSGYLFVAGGRLNGTNTPSGVVLSAKISADGTLGPFQNVTGLQRPLHDCALVAFKGRLYVFGGASLTARTDEVWSARINGDGTLGAWDAQAKLPSPRSDFVALAY